METHAVASACISIRFLLSFIQSLQWKSLFHWIYRLFGRKTFKKLYSMVILIPTASILRRWQSPRDPRQNRDSYPQAPLSESRRSESAALFPAGIYHCRSTGRTSPDPYHRPGQRFHHAGTRQTPCWYSGNRASLELKLHQSAHRISYHPNIHIDYVPNIRGL